MVDEMPQNPRAHRSDSKIFASLTGPAGAGGVLVAAAAAALLSAGCGGDSSQQALTSTAKAHPATAPAAATGTILRVTEKEYSISMSATIIKPGTYTVEVANRGKMSHNLNIKGPGVSTLRSPTVAPNTTADVAVTLQPGQYELWCSIDHHKALGMDTRIQVT